jgi:hypothetical protein
MGSKMEILVCSHQKFDLNPRNYIQVFMVLATKSCAPVVLLSIATPEIWPEMLSSDCWSYGQARNSNLSRLEILG